MPLLKKKNPYSIPPVSAPTPGANQSYSPSNYSGSYRTSSSATYVASRDGDSYNAPYASPMSRSSSHTAGYSTTEGEDSYAADKYSRSRGIPDAYDRGEANLEQDRNALLSGYKPQKPTGGSGRFFDGPNIGSSANPGEETEEDIEGIKQQTRFTKQESVQTTNNAIRMAREAEETAMNTLRKLGDQSEKLANTERHLDVTKGHSARAEDKTSELKQLNRSIFRPVIVWNKDEKRRAQEAKIHARFEEEKDERERAMMDIRDSQDRVGKAVTHDHNDEEAIGGGRRMLTATQQKDRMEQRKRFQFEETPSDNELEDQLDDNLDEISDITKGLKALGTAMGQELDQQNVRIDRIRHKTDRLDGHIFKNTENLKRIK